MKVDGPAARRFLRFLGLTAASPLRVVVAAPPQFLKKGARLTAAGCVEGWCSLALKGKVAASPQFIASFHRKGVSPLGDEGTA